MAARKSVLGPAPSHPKLDELIAKITHMHVTDDDFREQRVSFAYGNAPESEKLTKEFVRNSSKSFSLA